MFLLSFGGSIRKLMVSEEPQLFSISGFFTQYGTACHVFVMYVSYFYFLRDLSMVYSDVIAMPCIIILLTLSA
jgi:hypothetical protein